MSVQALSLLRWLALVGVLVALKLGPDTPHTVGWILWITFGLLVISAFVWPRCPHCGARVVRFNKREWFAGDFCWRCGKPYDESRTPAYAADLDRALEEADKVRKKDPAAFERILREAGQRYEESWEAELVALREKARSSAVAARVLCARLKADLKGLRAQQRALRRVVESDPLARERLQEVEAKIHAGEGELATLQATLV